MKLALVTGSNGFVGRHIVHRLVHDGWAVHGVDDLSTGLPLGKWPSDIYDGGVYFGVFDKMDVTNFCRLRKYVSYDLIVHCAAVVGGRLKIEGDPLAVATDLATDSEFFNWVVRLDPQPKKVVYFSSSAVYPIELQRRNNNCALGESFVNFDTARFGRPDLTYGWSKLSGEYLAQIAAKTYDLPVVIYRPFSGYGEDQDLSYPFPALIKRIVEHLDPITIWGSGDQLRDFIHIDDVVDAVFASMDKMEPGEVLNLGSGVGTSFRQLVAMAHTGIVPASFDLNIVADTTKPEGVFARVADTYKLSGYYTPKITLEEGILRVAAHLDNARSTV